MAPEPIQLHPRPQPEFQRSGLGYVYEPSRLGIRLRADYIRLDQHDCTAWLAAESTDGGHLHRARVRFGSTQAKTGFARQTANTYSRLNSRNDINWGDLVEVFAVMVEESERRVGEVVDVSKVAKPELLPDQVAGFLPKNKLTWLFGPGGSGKGHIATLVAICVAAGVRCFGRPVTKGNVLYLDWEDDENVLALRVDAICRGIGLKDKPPILYRSLAGPFRDKVHDVARIVSDHGIDFMIHDSARYAIGSEVSDTDAYVEAVKYINATTLVIDHVSKETIKTPDKAGMPINDVGKWNAARAAWEIRKDQEEGQDYSRIGLFNRKANYYGTAKPIGLRLEFDELDANGVAHLVRFAKDDVRQSEELSRTLSLPQRMEYILRGGAKAVKEVADLLGADENAVRVALNRNPRFTKIPDSNCWGIAAS